MPRDPEEGTIEVTEGEAPEAEEVSGEESFGFDEIPESVFDKSRRTWARGASPPGRRCRTMKSVRHRRSRGAGRPSDRARKKKLPESEGV